METKNSMENGGYDNMSGVNNNDVATLGLAGAIGGYGGYGGYGRGGYGNSEVGNAILYNQNERTGRDTLLNRSEIKESECDVIKSVNRSNHDLDNDMAHRSQAQEFNANARQNEINNRFREVATTEASNRMHDAMTQMNQFTDVNTKFALMETKQDLLCNKMNEVEKTMLTQKIQDLTTDKILAGQVNNRLEQSLSDFCCPKPSARYEVVGCGCPAPAPAPVQNISVIDIMNIVRTMQDNGNGHGGK